MRPSAHTSDSTQKTPTSTNSSTASRSLDERFLRNASLIDQDRINQCPAAIIGVGAIGSHLAETLAKLGVERFTLIDPDEVGTVNLSVQGFYESEIGKAKVEAVQDRLRSIRSAIQCEAHAEDYRPDLVPDTAAIFSCVDSMRVRRVIFRDYTRHQWPVFLDARMAAESLRIFCTPRNPEVLAAYEATLFPSHQAHRASCTAQSTIYTAQTAAALLCAQYKKWAMSQAPDQHIHFDFVGIDCFR